MSYKLLLFGFSILLFSSTSNYKKKKILIIGDSISIGYTPFVKKNLGNVYVKHNIGNAQDTKFGAENVNKWLGNEKWDIIQINWGLWDFCYRNEDSKVQGNRDKISGKITTSIEDYEINLDKIIGIIRKKSNAKIIFVTTTFVPEDELGRFQKDVQSYNEVAKQVMRKYNVDVNDIYDESVNIHKKYGKGLDDVHYTKKGYEKLGKLISNFIKKYI